jgi:hypothetical protein
LRIVFDDQQSHGQPTTGVSVLCSLQH